MTQIIYWLALAAGVFVSSNTENNSSATSGESENTEKYTPFYHS